MTVLKYSNDKPTANAPRYHAQQNDGYKNKHSNRSWKRPQSETSAPAGPKLEETVQAVNESQSPGRPATGTSLPILRGGPVIEATVRHSWKRPRNEASSHFQPAPRAIRATHDSLPLRTENAVRTQQDQSTLTLPTLYGGSKIEPTIHRSWKRPQSEAPSRVQNERPPAQAISESQSHSPELPTENLDRTKPCRAATALPILRGGPKQSTTQHSWKRRRDEAPLLESVAPSRVVPAISKNTTSHDVSTERESTSTQRAGLVSNSKTLTSEPDLLKSTLLKVGQGKLIRVAKKGTGTTAVTKKSTMPIKVKHQRHPAVKRIQIADKVDSKVDVVDETNSTLAVDTKPADPVRLTDHAYRSHQGTTRSLVRVPVDESTTRVCSTVFQRRRCTDPACRKRHDVAPECTIPICSFFQKAGMGCRSGDACPFQHVKVHARTPVCPSFGLLGFCEDTACTLLHLSK